MNGRSLRRQPELKYQFAFSSSFKNWSYKKILFMQTQYDYIVMPYR